MRFKYFYGSIIFFGLAMFASSASAATLHIEPQNVSARIGEFKNFQVYLDAEDLSVNAIQGTIEIPEAFELQHIYDGDSSIDFWVDKPNFSSGKIDFSGMIPGGFQDKKGLLFALRLKLASAPDDLNALQIAVNGVKVYKNDGLGTLVPASSSGTRITLLKDQGELKNDKDLVDTLPPEPFNIELTKLPGDSRSYLVFDARDKESGMDHYRVCENDDCTDIFESPYLVKSQYFRETIIVRAFDKMGNMRSVILERPGVYNALVPIVILLIAIILILAIVIFNFIKNRKILFVFFILFASLGLAKTSFAATLSLSPSSGTFKPGDTFTVTVNVSSNDKAINAVSGSISFQTDKLQVISVSKSSLVSLWVKEPSFSNSSGRVDFEGIILNPGFKGSSRILSITFKAKVAGTAKVSFVSANVLANDGFGTRILSGTGSGSYVISAQKTPEPVLTPAPKPVEKPKPVTPPAPPAPTPVPVAPTTTTLVVEAPEVFSLSHPDQEVWYKERNVRFVYKLSPQVDKLRIVLDQASSTEPNVEYPATIRQEYTLNQDGVWYIHLAQGAAGVWSQAAHFRIQVDSKPPDTLEIKDLDKGETTEPSFDVRSYDAMSGVAEYNYQVDNGPVQIWRDEGGHILRLKRQSSGSHTLKVASTDKAGNPLSKIIPFEIFMSRAEYSSLVKGLVAGMLALLAVLVALVIWIIKARLQGQSYVTFQKEVKRNP